MRRIAIVLAVLLPSSVAYFYKRTPYGDANEATDYVDAYYGFPSPNFRRRIDIYPSQDRLRQQHPFDFGPMVHARRIGGDANEMKTDRERVMEKARPGFWRRREIMDRLRGLVEEKRANIERKHMQMRNIIEAESAEIRSKFADLHKRLIMKNKKMVTSTTTTPTTSTINPPVELSKKAKKLEKEARKIMESPKMSNEAKIEKLDKLMLKAPEHVKTELAAINDSSSPRTPVVESRQIRISEDGSVVEI